MGLAKDSKIPLISKRGWRENGDVNIALDNIVGEVDRVITRTPVVELKLQERRDRSL